MNYAAQEDVAKAAYNAKLDREYATRSVNECGSIGGYVGEQVCEDCGDLEHIVRRINECIDHASSNAERVSILADRIKGTTPENKLDGAKLASGGNGAIADIHTRLDILVNALGATRSGIARIERL